MNNILLISFSLITEMIDQNIHIIKALNASLDTLNFEKRNFFKDYSTGDDVRTSFFDSVPIACHIKSIFVNTEDENKAMVLVLIDSTDEYLIPFAAILPLSSLN